MALNTKKEVAQERERITAETQRLERERKEIIEQSTANRLEHNRVAIGKLTNDRAELNRAEGLLVAALPADQREAELRAEAKSLMAQERGAASAIPSGIPTQCIRPDALAHFKLERDAAEARIGKLERPFRDLPPNVTMGPRIVEEIRGLQAVVDNWPNVEKMCHVGERIAEFRQRLKENVAAQAELSKERRREALAI